MIKIKKNTQYKKVYEKGKSVADYNLVLFYKKTNSNDLRFGFTAAKRMKLAVDRNFIRRRLKEIVRLNENKIKEGYDIVFMARLNATEADYKKLEKSFYKVLKRANLLK